MKHKLFILALPLVLLACGKKDEAAPTTQAISASAVSTAAYPDAHFPSISGYNGYYYVGYSYFENGCYTGYLEFTGHSSEQVRQRLCDGLQNTWLNRGCAPGQRQAYFNQMCTGIASWNPR